MYKILIVLAYYSFKDDNNVRKKVEKLFGVTVTYILSQQYIMLPYSTLNKATMKFYKIQNEAKKKYSL